MYCIFRGNLTNLGHFRVEIVELVCWSEFKDIFEECFICLILYKKYSQRNMFNGSNFDRKSQLSGVLSELLNPRDLKENTDKRVLWKLFSNKMFWK